MEWSTRSARGGGRTSGNPAGGGHCAGRAGSRGVVIGSGFVLAGAVALGALRFLGGSPVERDAQGALAAAALVAPYTAAAYLALVGRRDRPWLVAAAGTVLIPLSFVSFAGATLPFLVPAAVFLQRGLTGPGRWRPAGVVAAYVAVFALVASVVLLFVHQDPATWETATGGGSTSDIVTAWESLRSLLVVAGAVGVGNARAAAPLSGRGPLVVIVGSGSGGPSAQRSPVLDGLTWRSTLRRARRRPGLKLGTPARRWVTPVWPGQVVSEHRVRLLGQSPATVRPMAARPRTQNAQ